MKMALGRKALISKLNMLMKTTIPNICITLVYHLLKYGERVTDKTFTIIHVQPIFLKNIFD
jgi:hypothetical protein